MVERRPGDGLRRLLRLAEVAHDGPWRPLGKHHVGVEGREGLAPLASNHPDAEVGALVEALHPTLLAGVEVERVSLSATPRDGGADGGEGCHLPERANSSASASVNSATHFGASDSPSLPVNSTAWLGFP